MSKKLGSEASALSTLPGVSRPADIQLELLGSSKSLKPLHSLKNKLQDAKLKTPK
jgi:hypothetical protein